jgi:plasmid stability protein
MSREINPFGLRMPADLREKLEVEAAKAGRSMNAELVHRLQQSFFMLEQHEEMNQRQMEALTITIRYETLRSVAKRTATQEKEFQEIARQRDKFFHQIVDVPVQAKSKAKNK